MKYLLIGLMCISGMLFAQNPYSPEPMVSASKTATTTKWNNIKSNASQMKYSQKALANEKTLGQQRVEKVKEGSANPKTLGLLVKKAAAR